MAFRKKLLIGLCTTLTVVLAILAYLTIYPNADFRQPSNKVRTTVQLDVLKEATTDYFKVYGQWPVTMKDLTVNRSNIVFVSPSAPWKDGWGRPFIYTAPTNGAGTIVSLGRDGLPGGSNFDADLKVALP